jgi:uncharacterized membrane protein YfcA
LLAFAADAGSFTALCGQHVGVPGQLRDVLTSATLSHPACNLTGARLGVHFALERGSRFIRVVLLCVVIALVVKLAYDQFA